MPSSLATFLTIAGVLFLLRRDAIKGEARSLALWLPVMWLSITGSRFVTQWASLGAGAGDNFYEGSLIDAAYFAALIAAGTVVLIRRQVSLWAVVRANTWIAAFIAFGLLSVLWSDEPGIAAKRWIKTLGHPIMALIMLTELDPKAAILTVLKRCAFILLPVSVLFIKYLPEYGRGFDAWTGQPINNGIGLTKNDLGYECMVSGIVFFWSLVNANRFKDPETRRNERWLCIAFLLMALWLLEMSDSVTSLVAMVLGIVAMFGVGTRFITKRHFGKLVVSVVLIAWALESMFHVYETVIVMLGRNPTLTDRTLVWDDVLALQHRPLIGYGFESFWLGERLSQLWDKWWWRPTQAHNGYIETYLNLGVIGLTLLGCIILSTFRRISRQLLTDLELAQLRLAFLIAIILFNYTEAGFRGVGFMWTIFHIIAMEPPAGPALSGKREELLA